MKKLNLIIAILIATFSAKSMASGGSGDVGSGSTITLEKCLENLNADMKAMFKQKEQFKILTGAEILSFKWSGGSTKYGNGPDTIYYFAVVKYAPMDIGDIHTPEAIQEEVGSSVIDANCQLKRSNGRIVDPLNTQPVKSILK